MIGKMVALAAATALALAALAAYRRRGGVEGFEPAAGSGVRVAVIHAAWCGHCRDLLKEGGTWDRVKASVPTVEFVELDESEHGELVKSLGVTSFPDVRLLGVGNKPIAKFEGDRTEAALVAFAKEGAIKA